ncbi:MAG: hypothetical protein HY811_09385 [Planctomycetes bacterium]|nr:hypothetical protein [Planctomycetota bacterium]
MELDILQLTPDTVVYVDEKRSKLIIEIDMPKTRDELPEKLENINFK